MIYYKVLNPNGMPFYFDTIEKANEKLLEIQEQYLNSESHRFLVSIETSDGTNTVWSNADLNQGNEETIYQVFNHFSGQYESALGVSSANNLLTDIKQRTLESINLHKVFEVDKLPNNSQAGIGNVVGSIPVEVM